MLRKYLRKEGYSLLVGNKVSGSVQNWYRAALYGANA